MDPDSRPRTTRAREPRNTRKLQPRSARKIRPRNARKIRPRNARRTRITVLVTDGSGRSVPAPGLAAWLAGVAPKSAPREVTVALVSGARIRALNRKYRGKDNATDVLSFEPSDIAIATSVARRQAREAGHSYLDELKVLALHGLLHLMGYDHHARSDRARMARMERRLRAAGGLSEGLIERAGAVRRRRDASRPSERAKRPASDGVGESEGRSPSDRR